MGDKEVVLKIRTRRLIVLRLWLKNILILFIAIFFKIKKREDCEDLLQEIF
jgi:hypothetical protein